MCYSVLIFIYLILTINSTVSCNRKDSSDVAAISNLTNVQQMETKINISVNSKLFSATLLDNKSAKVLSEMLPMKINMKELNGNEKYFELPQNIPMESSNPGTVHNGDLMLYGSNTLVLFYRTFSTSYFYSKLGHIDSPAGLAEALGNGNVKVTITKN